MNLIALLTDFGLQDGYPAVMKGVIWNIIPEINIVDLSHSIPPQNVRLGAFTLGNAYHYFPDGTIFVCVIDPGVGTSRRPIAAKIGKYTFIAPDNGLLSAPIMDAKKQAQTMEIMHLNKPGFWLPSPSYTFHGRDIFAPVAAHLAKNIPFSELGTAIIDPVCLDFPTPQPIPNGWQADILAVDGFGNLITNLTREHLQNGKTYVSLIGGEEIEGPVTTFGNKSPGELLTFFDSSNRFSICVVNGSAARALLAGPGAQLKVIQKDE